MRGITKQFGSLVANDHVDFDLQPGEVHALLGENGAGKTTLMRILFGLYKADSGTIVVNGNPVQIHSPQDAILNGIGMVTQHFSLVPPFSVAENVALGYSNQFLFNKSEIEKSVAEAANRLGLILTRQPWCAIFQSGNGSGLKSSRPCIGMQEF